MLRTALSIDDFVAARVGARIRGRHWSYAVPQTDLCVGVGVGRFEMDDLHTLMPVLDTTRMCPPHVVMWDLTRIEAVEPKAFDGLEKFLVSQFANRDPIERVAVIAPASGALRAIAAGMFSLLSPPYPASAFTAIDAALAWLGKPTVVDLASLIESEATDLVEAAFDSVARAWLDAHVTEIDIDVCARALGVSVRTLQRRLSDRGVSFVDEANMARVRAAEERLASGASLTEIAYDLGFSSPQRFSSVFRQLRGQTPSAVRARMHPKA